MLVQIIIYSTANNNSNETKKSILMSLFYGLYIATTLLLISVLTETIESRSQICMQAYASLLLACDVLIGIMYSIESMLNIRKHKIFSVKFAAY